MLLRPPSAISASSEAPSSLWSCSAKPSKRTPRSRPTSLGMASGPPASRVLAGVVFEPFEEVKKEIALFPSAPDQSLARQKYADNCEAAINEQINVEYNVSYAYHAMFGYFDRDNVALKGLAKFFNESSEQEREHAEKLMKYQNKRGGKVKLQSILMPLNEFDHAEKGDALYGECFVNLGLWLYLHGHLQKPARSCGLDEQSNDASSCGLAMELALSLEKLVNEKLLNLHGVATRHDDVEMTSYIEHEFLREQVKAIKKMAEYVAQLRRVGQGHGVWHFDQMLLHEGDGA
ncbi:hypothetical protein Taro_034603 [Colocasia esculenta]|uniref:Ferritin n=1 Tax=Colocasia esculenta TaxID=4460 RepID=A0A843VRV2_COLES|nr:hypothetical protein [Colocasia esculenta]